MQSFIFSNFFFDYETGELRLCYKHGEHSFQEKIIFPNAPFSKTNKNILQKAFFWLHLAGGISYFKAFAPKKIIINSGKLTSKEASFFNRFYISGLGEWAVRNNINIQDSVHFPFEDNNTQTMEPILLGEGMFLAVGGGKDSCVSIELLKSKNPTLWTVGMALPMKKVIEKAKLPSVTVERTLSPHLLELNAQGTALNGHIPISGIIAFISLCLSILHNKKFVIMSNEQSANSGNTKQGKLTINHQWSKSFEFERAFYQLTRTLVPNFKYFSILRPLSEMRIAQLFASHCQDYFPIFTSCNKSFKLDKSKRLKHWCGFCDKCRFVFLILAPFMAKEQIISIIGNNLLNDPNQKQGFLELLGLSGHKPFECVGEKEECQLAWLMLQHQKEWENDILLRTIKLDTNEEALKKYVFSLSTEHLIPKELENVVK